MEMSPQVVQILRDDVPGFPAAVSSNKIACRGDFPKALDLRAENRASPETNLQAVEFRRVMAGSNHHAAITLKVVMSKIQHRRRTDPEVNDLAAACA